MGRPIAGNFDKFGGLAVWIETAKLKSANINLVPVRYRPNAASGGWSYGRDLVSLL